MGCNCSGQRDKVRWVVKCSNKFIAYIVTIALLTIFLVTDLVTYEGSEWLLILGYIIVTSIFMLSGEFGKALKIAQYKVKAAKEGGNG